jgi:hypothetical protein
VLAYKFTRPGGQGAFTGFRWPLPQAGEPGAWVRAHTTDVCVAGIHALRAEQLPHWLGPELWVIELAGDVTGSTVVSFDPSAAIVSVDLSVTVSQFGSTAADALQLTLVVNLEDAGGFFLTNAVANCSTGNGSELSLGFTNSDAEATC